MNILKRLFVIQEVRVVVTQDHDHDDHEQCETVCPDCGNPCTGEEGNHFGLHLCSSETCGIRFETPW